MAVSGSCESGPQLHAIAPNFQLLNINHRPMGLADLMGTHGLLLGFSGDIWQPVTMRRIIWLQRHTARLQAYGVEVALLVGNAPDILYGFQVSSTMALGFTLLADPDRHIHRLYNMGSCDGLVLLDRQQRIRSKWLALSERGWPQPASLIQTCTRL